MSLSLRLSNYLLVGRWTNRSSLCHRNAMLNPMDFLLHSTALGVVAGKGLTLGVGSFHRGCSARTLQFTLTFNDGHP